MTDHHQPFSQGATRPREGYLVGDVLRSSARINPEGSSGSRLSSKPGKSPERRREEASAGEDPRSIDKESPEHTYAELTWAGVSETPGDRTGGGAGTRTGENVGDSTGESYGNSTGKCVWCHMGYSGNAHLPCPEHELLHSVALEELAIANLINAEAEHVQAVARQGLPPLTADEFVAFQQAAAKVLELAVEKEKLLLQKLRLLLSRSGRRDDRGARPPARRSTESS